MMRRGSLRVSLYKPPSIIVERQKLIGLGLSIPNDAEHMFNMVLAFLGKHGISLGGLSLHADAVFACG